MELITEYKVGLTFENEITVIHRIKRKREEKPWAISVDREKALDKIQHTFILKTQETRNRKEFPQPVTKNLQQTVYLIVKN